VLLILITNDKSLGGATADEIFLVGCLWFPVLYTAYLNLPRHQSLYSSRSIGFSPWGSPRWLVSYSIYITLGQHSKTVRIQTLELGHW